MTENTTKSAWATLSPLDVNGYTEKKGKFTYLSWAHAWAQLKKHYPRAIPVKAVNVNGYPAFFDEQGFAFVKAGVSLTGDPNDPVTYEFLPVLDNTNKPIKNPNSFDVNTALQRCLVKALAFEGLGLYIYAGEDLPEVEPQHINDQQVANINDRIALIEGDNIPFDLKAFLKMAKADKIEHIDVSNYDNVIRALDKKLGGKK